MADKTVLQETAGGPVQSVDSLRGVQNGDSVRFTFSQIATWVININNPYSIRVITPATADFSSIFAGPLSGNLTLSPGGGSSFLASANVGFGSNLLYSLTTGYYNVALGFGPLQFVTTGHDNIGIGFAALTYTTTGMANVGIGTSALQTNTTGGHNTAVGTSAQYNNTTGTNNVSVGRDSNYSNTIGNWNTCVGVDSNPGSTSGSGNTVIGGECFYGSDFADAVANQNLTGSNNTMVGYHAGSTGGPGGNTQNRQGSTAIGYNAKVNADNQVVIGGSNVTETILQGSVKPAQITLTGTAGAGFIDLSVQSATPVTPAASYIRAYSDASSRMSWLFSSGFLAKLDPVALTGTRVYGLPDASGTFLYGGGPLGTPASGIVTNLTGTASININGTVGATTPSTGSFTTATLANGSGNGIRFKASGGTSDAQIFEGAGGALNIVPGSANTLLITGVMDFNVTNVSKNTFLAVGNVFSDATDTTSGATGSISSLGGIGATKAIFAGTSVTATTFLKSGSFTVAGLPAGTTGASVYCSNCRVFNGAGVQEGGGAGTGGRVDYNGTAWKIAGTNVTAVA